VVVASDSQAGSQAGSQRKSPQLRDLFWLTPTVNDAKPAGTKETAMMALYESGRNVPDTYKRLRSQVGAREDAAARTWATPKANDAMQPGATPGKSDARQPLTTQVGGGRLNPTWVEWLMGFPLGWTLVDDEPASAALGTASSPNKQRSRS
jgi:hypothetical protein